MDEALTAVLQAVAQRAGVSPADLELLVNFAPTAVDLSRYPALQSLSLAQLRARACVIKHCNRLAAPLLGYSHGTDTRKAFKPTTESHAHSGVAALGLASAASPSDSDLSLSATVRKLKGLYFLGTKKAVFDAFLVQQQPQPVSILRWQRTHTNCWVAHGSCDGG